MPTSGAPDRPLACVVTGAAGFIGSHLAERLLADGHLVLGVDCFTDYYPREVKERNLAASRAQPGFRFAEADLRSADVAALVAGADVVFHLAAMGGLLRSWTGFDDYLSCNVLATQRLLEALRETGVGHLVHISTSSVYGRDSSGDETRPTAPVSPYGVTKLAAENLVRAYAANFGLPFTILRYYSIYGPRQRPDMGYHIFIERTLTGQPITLYGDGTQSRGNTYVDDCVAATVAAARHGPTGEALNVGGGEVISARGALALIEELAGRSATVHAGPPRPGEQDQALADTSRIRSLLGWRPETGLRAGLAAQVAWQRAALAQSVAA
jgi:nucleoside-diphosphate-sugar epimerase